MNILKNRTVLGVICILLSLVICFAVTPLFNSSLSQRTSIVRVSRDIKAGDKITGNLVQTVEVGSYNLPSGVIKNKDAVIGKYASADMKVGDYILNTKLSAAPAAENSYLYSLNGEKQAMSVTVRSFASGLSGKLMSGDIVSVIAPDYKNQGTAVIPEELQYVEVIGVTASTGYDTDTKSSENTGKQSEDKEKELPSTVTLLVSPVQSEILAGLESGGKLHLSLVYRGIKENADKFIDYQDKVIKTLHPETGKQTENTGSKDTEGIITENAQPEREGK
ncbi:MAG TPA: Flp pilus assembly protein CpaB [Ruminiclostridium sp.]|nr:Flp pilus assembly protein CpaB [Ruminiclostridium sp.]